jgi:hypothetical protein
VEFETSQFATIAEAHDGDREQLIAIAQQELRSGSMGLARELADIVVFPAPSSTFDPDDRALALEILAAARSSFFDELVANVIAHALVSDNEAMQFAAIAAVSNLPCSYRASLITLLRSIADSPDVPTHLRSAASASLKA